MGRMDKVHPLEAPEVEKLWGKFYAAQERKASAKTYSEEQEADKAMKYWYKNAVDAGKRSLDSAKKQGWTDKNGWPVKEAREMTVPDKHMMKIAKDTLKMHPAMAGVMGGPSPEEAKEIIKQLKAKYGMKEAIGVLSKIVREEIDNILKEATKMSPEDEPTGRVKMADGSWREVPGGHDVKEAGEPKDWECQECGRRMTATSAMRAINSDRGCPGCGGVDIDQAPYEPQREATTDQPDVMMSRKPSKDVFPETDKLEIQLHGSWVKVGPMEFRSWTGPRRRNGQPYKGPRYLWMTDTPSSPSQVTKDEAQNPRFADEEQEIFDSIRPGSKVTIVDRFGKERTGRAVMRGPAGWVLNMGGAHGTPAIATPDNFIDVKEHKLSLKSLISEKRTPWGMSDAERPIGQGIVAYQTPSHGGYYVPSNLLNKIDPAGRAYAKKYSGSENWYEEDIGWAFVWVAFPELFKNAYKAVENMETAKDIVKRYSKGGERYGESVNEEVTRIIKEATWSTPYGGREIYKDGKHFITITKKDAASPSEADALGHLIVQLLNKADWDSFYKKYMES